MKKYFLVFLILCGVFYAWSLRDDRDPPYPPEKNPHPPQTEMDHKRVDLAVESLEKYLKMVQPETTDTSEFAARLRYIQKSYGLVTEYIHPHVIPWSLENFEKKKKGIPPPMGSIVAPMEPPPPETQRPVLKDGEYMVHIYVRFDRTKENWFHLDVILGEKKEGNIELRGFFVAPFPTDSKLPLGVVC